MNNSNLKQNKLVGDPPPIGFVFKNIRCDEPLNILQEQPKTLDLVIKLTKLNPEMRPAIEEILADPYFSD
ncbi:hypothetical protein PRIPAC_96774 [Pristionchus pacificus]|uniref:Uncharacterized protein n=1 Tax=Pristionchus pacificus TaxID=54126 RepID=A0A2A6B2U0_PRIPA|nr:hypothetical protein PRIPAC_96774 [Pristionchus pacificus]|eukprot:PDM60190.1 hypothetical protein PRIPAC_54015 [Pristionchus pacificus]